MKSSQLLQSFVFVEKRRAWNFVTCDKLGEVFLAAAGIFGSPKKQVILIFHDTQ